jgi:hypothetical protein
MVVTDQPGRVARPVARTLLSIAAFAALGWWMLWATFLVLIRCGDTCSGDAVASGRWGYTGQFLLAAPSAAAGMLGLALGFTRHQRASWRLLCAAGCGAFVWVVLVLGVGGL